MPAHFVPAEETPITDAMTLKGQKPSGGESVYERVLLSVVVLGSLLIVWVLAVSAAPWLPALALL